MMEFPVDKSKDLKKKALTPGLILRPIPVRQRVGENTDIIFSYLKDVEDVGTEAEEAFAEWIYNFSTDFLHEINLEMIPKRQLAIDNAIYQSINEYYGLILEETIDTMDRVNINHISPERLLVDIFKPLHRYPMNSDLPILAELSDNLSKIAVYGLSRIEEELFNKLKSVEITIVDRYTLIPSKIIVNLVQHKPYDFWLEHTYLLNIFISFEFVDEKDYLVGGNKYKEGEIHFSNNK